MNRPYTPKERAYRTGTLAWLGVIGAFIFLLLSFVYDGASFLAFCLTASAISAVFGLLLGSYSVFLVTSYRAGWATILSALVLGAYGLLLYLMRDFCVIC